MIRTFLAIGAGIAFLLVAASDSQPPSPPDTLKSKGLKRSGDLYILGVENEVQKAVNETRAASKAAQQILDRKKQFDQRMRDGDGLARELIEQRILLNRQLSEAGNAFEHNRVVGMLNEVNDRLNLLQRELNDPDASQSAGAQVAMKRELFVEKVLKLRQVVDQATAEYAAIAQDTDVRAAIDALTKAGPRAAKLGPSKTFLNNVKNLETVEKSVLTDVIALRKDGGIFWLDVTFNGKTTRPMAFDTGASMVVLPYAMAKEVGLTPGSDAPTVKTKVADGSITEAKKVIAPMLRVGRFVVKDVECMVMPANKTDVPPLLGQTFQKHFMIRFDPEGRKLVLTKIETEDAPAAKTKAGTKTKR